jgi:predicted protein tyrosine phosphatase
MALVKVLSEQTEAEIVETLRQLQIALASAQELIQRGDRMLGKLERMIDAVSTAGIGPNT